MAIQSEQELIDFINRSKWKYAKTMPQSPHSYTLKEWCDPIQFEEAVMLIRKIGRRETFGKYTYTYFYSNGFKYWSMGAPLMDTILINKAATGVRDYDFIAPKYDNLFIDQESQKENREVFGMISEYCQSSILDIGCGTGLLLDLMQTESADYTGIDPSPKMLEGLLRKHPTAKTHKMKYEDYTLINGNSFDFIASLFGSISYVNPEKLRNIFLHLNPGATYFLMFYKPKYECLTYQKTGIYVPHFNTDPAQLENLFDKVYEYHNFLIATNI